MRFVFFGKPFQTSMSGFSAMTPAFHVLSVGNWGDEERTRELEEFLIGPASSMRDCHVAVHGVRYPAEARQKLSQAGIEYRGYLCNLKAPLAYAKSFVSLHVPRRYYSN